MINALNYFHNILIKVVNFLIGFMIAGMVIIVFSNVISRYFLNASIAWSEEISRWMFIWLVFLGAIMAYVNNEHLGLDIIIKLFPKKITQLLIILADVLVLIVTAIMLKGGIDMTADSFASGWVSSAVPIKYGYVYLAVPLSMAILLIEIIVKLAKDMIGFTEMLKGGK